MARTLRLRRRNRTASMNRKKVVGKKSKVARKNRTRRRVRLFRGGDEPKNILLIIDPQNDFTPDSYTDNGNGPTLAVPNADNDLKKLATFLENTTMNFDEIHVSLDSHTKTHIAHLGFWDLSDEQISIIKEQNGIVGFRLNPSSLGKKDIDTDIVIVKDIDTENANENDKTMYNDSIKIELWDLKTGDTIKGCHNINPKGVVTIGDTETKINTLQLKKTAVDYINKLTLMHNINNDKPLPNTWPDHCIIGSAGWKIYEPLANALANEKFTNKVFIHEKGTNDLVEMYSIFKAEVTYNDLYPRKSVDEYNTATVPTPNHAINVPNAVRNYSTILNTEFIKRLRGETNKNKVYVCGEAKTHCVKTSAEDLVGDNGENVFMLYNVMSDITYPKIFVDPRKAVFQKLKDKKVQFATINENTNTIEINKNYEPDKDNYPN